MKMKSLCHPTEASLYTRITQKSEIVPTQSKPSNGYMNVFVIIQLKKEKKKK